MNKPEIYCLVGISGSGKRPANPFDYLWTYYSQIGRMEEHGASAFMYVNYAVLRFLQIMLSTYVPHGTCGTIFDILFTS